MKAVTITLPDYRAKSRNKTITSHWRTYQKYRDEASEMVAAYTNYKKFRPIEPAQVTISAFYKGKVGVDTSNIDDKLFVDALMHIGLLTNDTAKENPIVIKKAFLSYGENKVEIMVEKAL